MFWELHNFYPSGFITYTKEYLHWESHNFPQIVHSNPLDSSRYVLNYYFCGLHKVQYFFILKVWTQKLSKSCNSLYLTEKCQIWVNLCVSVNILNKNISNGCFGEGVKYTLKSTSFSWRKKNTYEAIEASKTKLS